MPRKIQFIDGEKWTDEDRDSFRALQRKYYRCKPEYREKQKQAQKIRHELKKIKSTPPPPLPPPPVETKNNPRKRKPKNKKNGTPPEIEPETPPSDTDVTPDESRHQRDEEFVSFLTDPLSYCVEVWGLDRDELRAVLSKKK